MSLLDAFVLLGTVAFSISGTLVGIKKEMDLFGVLCLCVITALGGGMIRDLLIGNIPPTAFTHPTYVLISMITGLVTWFFYQKIHHLKNIIMISDAIGLGVFTAIGSQTALTHAFNGSFIVIMMGLITGIGGGIIRDVFAKEIPYVFKKEVYAVASIVGAISLLCTYTTLSPTISLYICSVVTFSIRVLSVLYNWHIPTLKIESVKPIPKK